MVKKIENIREVGVTNTSEIEFMVSSIDENAVINWQERFFLATNLSIFTGSGGAGTQLAVNSDYVLEKQNTTLTGYAGSAVYGKVRIINPSYLNTRLYIPSDTMLFFGDFVDAADINKTQGYISSQTGYILDELPNLFKDTAQDTPEDGTGGTATALTLSYDTTTPLYGDSSPKVSKSAVNAQGEGWSIDKTIDRGMLGKTLKLSFDYRTTAQNVACFIYDKDNSKLMRLSVEDVPTSNDETGSFYATFIPSASLNYKVIWFIKDTSTTAWDFTIDNIVLGVKKEHIGDVGKWVTVYDEPSNDSDVSSSSLEDFEEDSYYKITLNSDSTSYTGASQTLTMNIIKNSGSSNSGLARINESMTVSYSSGVFSISKETGVPTYYIKRIEKWIQKTNIKTIESHTEYASNSSTTDSDDTTSFVYGLEGASGIIGNTNLTDFIAKRIEWKQAKQADDSYTVEFYDPNTKEWASTAVILSSSDSAYLFHGRAISDNPGGIFLRQIDSYHTDVIFLDTPYGTAIGWGDSKYSGARWRVKKVSSSNVAELPPIVRYEGYNCGSVTNGYLKFLNKAEDTHNCYDTTTGTFVCKYDGVYQFSLHMYAGSSYTGGDVQTYINDVAYEYLFVTHPIERKQGLTTLRLKRGDYVNMYQTGSVGSTSSTWFKVERIGA